MSNSSWSKLAWPLKALILAIPVVVLSFIAVSNGWFKSGESTEKNALDNSGAAEMQPPGKDTGTTSAGVNRNNFFSYLPEKPVEGKLKGVVEVGAAGFNSFVVNIDKEKRWELVSKDFGKSLVFKGLATTNDISTGLKNYMAQMAEKGVDRKDMHFLISSGAQKDPKTKTIAAELTKMGLGVILVTAQQEGEWGLKSILPASYYGTGFVTDIGSGNTKISWMNGNKIQVLEGPGSKYYEKDMKNEDVYATLKEQASTVPASNREVCFIMGGSPYDIAKQFGNENDRYTVLKNPEDYAPNKPKTKAGLNIYKAIRDATGCKTFVFDWDANFTIGYLLDLPY